MIQALKHRAAAAATSAAAGIVALQIILPTFFDLLTGLCLVGLMWIVAKTR